MKIYTKKGDQGETDIIGSRVLKNNILIELVGEIDEASARLALVKYYLTDKENKEILSDIDTQLFKIASMIVDPKEVLHIHVDESAVKGLENHIDQIEQALPKLTAFITYDGHIAGIELALLRSQIRKIERLMIDVKIENTVIQYLNRLSDFLFVWMRYINHSHQMIETKR